MDAALPTPASLQAGTPPDFDAARLEGQSRLRQWLCSLVRYPRLQYLLDVLRWIKPVWRIPVVDLTVVLRHDHVREVLSQSRQFPVPWDWKMKLVTSNAPGMSGDGGRNFVLGMREPDPTYRDDYALLAHAFPYREAWLDVARLAREATEQQLNEWAGNTGTGGSFDVLENLVLAVPAMLCETYYGIPIPDKVHFGKCTLAVSSFLFGPDFDREPGGKISASMQLALDAAAPMRHIIRSAMNACASASASVTATTPLHRLMQRPAKFGAVDDDRIHVQLFGMVMGFIPTNVLAAGNLLETLLDRPEFMRSAVAAAQAGDDERLWRCLRETLRFRNINLGPLRTCAETYDLANQGASSTRIRRGEKVLACTQSAMFDRRRIKHPHLFDIGRADEDYLVFGVGQHWCIGAYIAIAQITQMFKVLLTRYEVKRAPGTPGRMKHFNVFPLHLHVQLSLR